MGSGERSWFETYYEVEGGAQSNPPVSGLEVANQCEIQVILEEGEHQTYTFSWLYDIIYELGSCHSEFHVNF